MNTGVRIPAGTKAGAVADCVGLSAEANDTVEAERAVQAATIKVLAVAGQALVLIPEAGHFQYHNRSQRRRGAVGAGVQ